MKNKAFTLVELMAIIVIMASMLLIILPAINNTIKNSEEKKKQDAINNIYMAAENYLMANYEEYLNLDNVGAVEYVYITDLISNNYLSIDTVNPNNDLAFNNQDAVKVTKKEDGTFSYELIYLKTLIELLLEQYQEGTQTGLVKDSINPNLYYYKGTNEEVANNFLWYGGHQWRVLEFDTKEDTLTLITQQPLTAIQLASSVWTTEEEYNESYINAWLNDYFWNSLDSSIQNNILDNTFNVGIYGETVAEQNIEKIKTIKKVGLLNIKQYLRAGELDSFLDIKDAWWLGNGYNASGVNVVGSDGNIGNLTLNYAVGVRPLIKISNIIVKNGDGTLISNYNNNDKVNNISEIQVGEYISVPYKGNDNVCGSDNECLFRVVSKDNDSIKVILNGLLPNSSLYGDTTKITTNHTIYTSLNNFANSISNDYLYTENKNFYIGDYYDYENYKNVQDETLRTIVGLPTVGEMFSGNDIDSDENRTFVDINTIENSNVSGYFWTMNRYSSDRVRDINKAGYLSLHFITTSEYYIRPVMFLKNNLEFTGGDGTAQNPYTLN